MRAKAMGVSASDLVWVYMYENVLLFKAGDVVNER